MDLKPEFYEASAAVAAIDFANTTSESANLFETTIRHLGGLLSAYDLSGEGCLREKAVELGGMLYMAFDTPNRLPSFWLNFNDAKNGKQVAGINEPSASPASLSLEFTRLSRITGDPKFYDATDRVTQFLQRIQSSTDTRDVAYGPRLSEHATGDTFRLGALADSLYEYRPKIYALLGGDETYGPCIETLRKRLHSTCCVVPCYQLV